MEQRNNLVLQGTETFSRGQLDNVALDGGALVDSGTHAQLLERCGVYREIYASQTGGNLNA